MWERPCDCPLLHENYSYEDMPAGEYGGGDIVIPGGIVIGEAAFSITRISMGAFNKCTELTSVELPAGLLDIRRGAFHGCTSLTEVTRRKLKYLPPYGDTEFYPDVFRGCTSLRKVDLTGASYLWNGIFQDCPNLEEVELYTYSNQHYAFRQRTGPSIKKLILHTAYGYVGYNSPDDGPFFFDEEYENAEVIVPQGDLELYANHEIWGRFKNLHEEGEASEAAPEVRSSWTIKRLGDNSFRIAGDFRTGELFTTDGTRLMLMDEGRSEFSVPSHGIYVLKIDGESIKILF